MDESAGPMGETVRCRGWGRGIMGAWLVARLGQAGTASCNTPLAPPHCQLSHHDPPRPSVTSNTSSNTRRRHHQAVATTLHHAIRHSGGPRHASPGPRRRRAPLVGGIEALTNLPSRRPSYPVSCPFSCPCPLPPAFPWPTPCNTERHDHTPAPPQPVMTA